VALIITGALLLLVLFAGVTVVMVREGGWETAAWAWGVALTITAVAGAGSWLLVAGLQQ